MSLVTRLAPALIAVSASSAFADTAILTVSTGSYRGGIATTVIPNITPEICKEIGRAASVDRTETSVHLTQHANVTCISDDRDTSKSFECIGGACIPSGF
jgi:hypothetical protein